MGNGHVSRPLGQSFCQIVIGMTVLLCLRVACGSHRQEVAECLGIGTWGQLIWYRHLRVGHQERFGDASFKGRRSTNYHITLLASVTAHRAQFLDEHVVRAVLGIADCFGVLLLEVVHRLALGPIWEAQLRGAIN